MDELEKDMAELAKYIYELSKKHGAIYVNAACVDDAELSFATYRAGDDLVNQYYYPDVQDGE